MKMKKHRIYTVIPAYNESDRVVDVVEDVKKYGYQVIVVDDGSTDDTYKKAEKLGVRVFRHGINLGKGAALKTGVEAAFNEGADAVILMDSDGQHKAKDLNKFAEELNSGYDVVFGSRNMEHGVPLVRYLGNKAVSVLVSVLFNVYVSDIPCGFKAFTKRAYKKIKWESTGYGVETEIVIRTGVSKLSRCEVPIATVYYDKYKGFTILDAVNVMLDIFRWRIKL
jgi:glycosyltransferase involved in cell wall biosynthesis